MRRLRERDKNPLSHGGPLTPCASSIAGITFDVLVAKGYLSRAQADDTSSPEGKKVLAQAVSNYTYSCSLRDAKELGL